MADSTNDLAGWAAPTPAHRRPGRRLVQALISTDSYLSVLLLILFTYVFSVAVAASWAASLVVTVQIGTVWVVLQVSQARRWVRRMAAVFVVISALAAVVNLFVGRETTGQGAVAFMSAVLYLIAPLSITRHLLVRYEVDLQTVLGGYRRLPAGRDAVRLHLPLPGRCPAEPVLRGQRARAHLAGSVLLLHHGHHDRVRKLGAGRQPGPELHGA